MNNNITWLGNKVFDPSVSTRTTQPAPGTVQTQPGVTLAETQQGPPPSTERGYIPYYLASNIGKNVRAEFIIGANQYADKTGVLVEVGINYFVLNDVNSRTNIMCDLYSVKFVTILLPMS